MKRHRTQLRFVAVASAVVALALAAGPSGTAKSRIPELGDADPPAKADASAPKRRALFVLTRVSSSPCGTETFAIEVNGRRLAQVC